MYPAPSPLHPGPFRCGPHTSEQPSLGACSGEVASLPKGCWSAEPGGLKQASQRYGCRGWRTTPGVKPCTNGRRQWPSPGLLSELCLLFLWASITLVITCLASVCFSGLHALSTGLVRDWVPSTGSSLPGGGVINVCWENKQTDAWLAE